MTKRRAAVKVASEMEGDKGGVVILSTGVRVKIHPVSATLIDAVQARIEDPSPPMAFIDEKGREEPNYSDPKYLRAVERAGTDRVIAAMDALILFGVELIDGLPEDESWLNNLRLLERLGTLDLSDLDLDNKLDAEFAYKRYVAMSPQDIGTVAARTGLGEGDIAAAEATFRSTEG